MKRIQMPRRRSSRNAAPNPFAAPAEREDLVDLERRRDQLRARVAELQWDLGGLVYEMAIRDHIKVDVLVRRAAVLQEADAELGEVERILRTEQTGAAGSMRGAPGAEVELEVAGGRDLHVQLQAGTSVEDASAA